ncbi:MAG: M23 family metallopeptidase [Cyanobacteria bacterium J06628_6]
MVDYAVPALIVGAVAVTTWSARKPRWPISGAFKITSEFGWRTNPVTGDYTLHRGVDIAPRPRGESAFVLSPFHGEVSEFGEDEFNGQYVKVINGHDRVLAVLTHLESHAQSLAVGRKVSKGEVLGVVGSTGRSTGVHLHVGFYSNQDELLEPTKYISTGDPRSARREAEAKEARR